MGLRRLCQSVYGVFWHFGKINEEQPMKLRLLVVLIVVSLASQVCAAQPKKKSAKVGDVKWTSDQVDAKVEIYKTVGDVELKMFMFVPNGHKASDARPAIVFFFGGGWNGGTPTQFLMQSEYLATRGMVAMAAEYRVKSRNNTTPFECVKDGKSAVRWIRANAARLGIDPGRIAAGGGSAGGHVAAATATTQGIEEEGEDTSVSPRPCALVLFNPVYNNGPGQWGHDRVKDRYQEISPAHNIRKGTPPAIVFLGTEDKLIPVSVAQDYKSDMEKIGSRSELILFEGQGHGFFNFKKGGPSVYAKTVHAMDKFLASLGYLEGEPTIELSE
jgi:acetyl esterase